MTIESQIRIDLAQNGIPPIVSAMQFDANTRVVKVSLFANGVPFVPEDCTVSVAYKKPDGTSGWYDKLPDESEAVSVADNVVTAILAPQVLTAPGNVCAAIRLDAAPNRISSFPFIVSVTEDPGNNAVKSENYYSVQNWDDVNTALAAVNETLADTVRYTAQEKTAEQKRQARVNIGAIDADNLPHHVEIYCNVKEKDIRGNATYDELRDWLMNNDAVTAFVKLTIEEGAHSVTTATVFCDEDRHVRFDLAELGVVELDSDGVWIYREPSSGGNADIDDTAVGAAAWSSRNIVDKLCPGFSESGAVVSCEPVEGYPLSVVSSIEAAQEGSGYPRPAGWAEVESTTLAPSSYCDAYDNGYAVYTTEEDLIVGKKYKLTVNAKNASGERVKVAYGSAFDKNGSYGSKIGCEVSDYDIVFTMTLDSENTSGVAQADIQISFAEAVDESSILQWDEGGDVSLVDGAFVLSEYDPGNVRPITGFDAVQLTHGNIEGSSALTAVFGQTVGKGTYDWSTGELKITHALIRLTSDMKWTMTGESNPNGIRSFYVNENTENARDSRDYPVRSSHYINNYNWAVSSVTYENAIKILNSRIYLTDARFTDLASFKAFLAEETVQLMYPLAEPVTVQLDPQEILALSGENTLTSDTGDTTVSGKADPAALFDKLISAIVAMGGNV